ncbi:hypothetical protein PCE1_003972 [Barthelona sp. PCE]
MSDDEFELDLDFSRDRKRTQTEDAAKSQKTEENSDDIRVFPSQYGLKELAQMHHRVKHAVSFKKQEIEDLFGTLTDFSQLEGVEGTVLRTITDVFGFERPTLVQSKSLAHVVMGKDVLIRAATGSGKTLAYLLPILLHMLSLRKKDPTFNRSNGINAVIVAPTRELVIQINDEFTKLSRNFPFIVSGNIIGGESKKSQKAKLRKGLNVLVGTPGRLLDHLTTTEAAKNALANVEMFVIDEADKTLIMNLGNSVKAAYTTILNATRVQPQVVMCSATLQDDVTELATELLRDNSVWVKTNEDISTFSVPDSLVQYYTMVPAKSRLPALMGLVLWKHTHPARGIIYVTTCAEVDFLISMLMIAPTPAKNRTSAKVRLPPLFHGVTFIGMHGNMSQEERNDAFKLFKKNQNSVLVCTDVAARGLDFSEVQYVCQYDLPSSAADYVHRIGRTARAGNKGDSYIFLQPQEYKMLEYLGSQGLELFQLELNVLFQRLTKLIGLTNDAMTLTGILYGALMRRIDEIEKDKGKSETTIPQMGREAFFAYVKAYKNLSRELKKYVNFKNLHLGHLCKSFCLSETPKQIGSALRSKHHPQAAKGSDKKRAPKKQKEKKIAPRWRPRKQRR